MTGLQNFEKISFCCLKVEEEGGGEWGGGAEEAEGEGEEDGNNRNILHSNDNSLLRAFSIHGTPITYHAKFKISGRKDTIWMFDIM